MNDDFFNEFVIICTHFAQYETKFNHINGHNIRPIINKLNANSLPFTKDFIQNEELKKDSLLDFL